MDSNSFGGPWTRDKLEILRLYLDAYTTALKKQPFNLIYVDAFAGPGTWSPRTGYELDDYGDFIDLHQGSPKIALEVQDKAFDKFVFIEINPELSKQLKMLQIEHPHLDIEVVTGDANEELPRFCNEMKDFDRAVVFLDPFNTEVAWDTVEAVALTKKIDCWILFPRMAIARLMPRNNPPTPDLANRLNGIFGGRQYWEGLYDPSLQLSFFEDEARWERQYGSQEIAARYVKRLESVFEKVAPTRRTLRNSKDSPMFELFFAAGNQNGAPTAIRIANHILTKW